VITLVDGLPSDTIPVTDSAVLRGDGCFEAIRCYDGRPYALDWHLDRLDRSAGMLGIDLPDREDLVDWCLEVARGGDGVIRVTVSRGDAVPGYEHGPRCVVMHHGLPARRPTVRLLPVVAPWHPAGRDWELAGAKTLSYAPNLAAGRTAQTTGFDDAMLYSEHGVILEGPTFTVAWVVDGVVETPSLGLHILDSITRRTVLAAADVIGVEAREMWAPIERLDEASEVMAWSTVKEVTPVVAVGDRRYEPGPVSAALAEGFRRFVASRIDD
jgi:branched-chain amino acid aminotransferase